jgi:hypothetical protein
MVEKEKETKEEFFVSVSSLDEEGFDFSWADLGSDYSNIETDETKDSSSSPERMMFIAVFIQSLLDATKEKYEGEPTESVNNRRAAHKWFSVPSCVTASTFEPICELAGIDPDYARRYYKKVVDGEIEFPYRRINVLINASKD